MLIGCLVFSLAFCVRPVVLAVKYGPGSWVDSTAKYDMISFINMEDHDYLLSKWHSAKRCFDRWECIHTDGRETIYRYYYENPVFSDYDCVDIVVDEKTKRPFPGRQFGAPQFDYTILKIRRNGWEWECPKSLWLAE